MNNESVNNVNGTVDTDDPIAILLKDKICKGKKYRFVNINPGFNKKFGHIGHHLNQNLLLKNKVIEDGGDFFVLCCNDLSYDAKFRNLPIFTYTPWKLLKGGDSEEFYHTFKTELQYIIELICREDDSTKNLFFMYMADIRLIPTFLEVAKNTKSEKNRNFFFINLFHAYKDFYPKGKAAKHVNEELLAILKTTKEIRDQLGVFLFVDTETFQNRIYNFTKERVYLLPKFTSAFTGDEFDFEDEKQLDHRKKKKLTFLYPTATKDRGLDFFVEMISFLVDRQRISPFRFVTRSPHPEDILNQSLPKKSKEFVEIKRGPLSNEEYKALFKEADVIFLPYKKEDFFVRSSGVFADAIIAQKPVLTTSETWIGRNTKKYNNGVTFAEENVNSLWDAMLEIKDNYKNYLENSKSAKSQWLKNNSLDVFFKMLHHLSIDRKEVAAIDSSIIDMLRILQKKNCLLRLVDKDLNLIEKLKQGIAQRNTCLAERNRAIETMTENIKEKDLLLTAGKKTIGILKKTCNKFKNMAKKNKIIEELKQEILKRNQILEQRKRALDISNAANISKNKIITERNEAIRELKVRISNMTLPGKEKKGEIEILREANNNNKKLIRAKNKVIEELKEGIDKKNRLLEEKNKAIEELKQRISEKDYLLEKRKKEIDRLREANDNKSKAITERSKVIVELRQRFLEREYLLKERKGEIDKLREVNSNKSKLIADRSKIIEELRLQISKKELLLGGMKITAEKLETESQDENRNETHGA
jgi:glycosyltransferase involved in cell wall biosynthesis